MKTNESQLHDYTVIGMFLNPEGFFDVKVSLNKKEKFKVILKFASNLIEDLFGSSLSEEEIEYKLNTKLMENGKFLFFRLVRYAIGNQRVQTQLKTNQNGVFIITADKWQTIMEKIDNEELQAILAHGLEDV